LVFLIKNPLLPSAFVGLFNKNPLLPSAFVGLFTNETVYYFILSGVNMMMHI
jgi:hypothetical protein